MPFTSADLVSSFPWPLAGSVACALHAYSTVLGSRVDGLLLLGALGLQARPPLSHQVAAAANYIKSVDTPVHIGGISASALGSVLAAAAVAVVLCRMLLGRATSTTHHAAAAACTGPGKPLLFPCVTTHTRKFPEKHSFVYSYLVVGTPVSFGGVGSGGMISASAAGAQNQGTGKGTGWFHVDAADHLERGNDQLGLRGKMDTHLRNAHGIDPAAYPHAYLVTAARFLGYQFNPVSFWYLYDADKTLAAMILEVNNTFGERHMYLLARDTSASSGATMNSRAQLFKQTWPKDFHVSPFNSRQGSYKLLANDPLAPNMQGTGPLSVTIVLRSSQAHSKIVASLTSAHRSSGDARPCALDPNAMTLWQRTRFLASWWWVGLVTLPRILRQAGTLFFSKKLCVWCRPEPLARSMSRVANETEQQLEAVFRLYLRHLVESSGRTGSSTPLAVKYVPCGIVDSTAETFYSANASKTESGAAHVAKQDGTVTAMEFRVLTPVFYTRFVHYAHDVEALFCELRESCTVSISPPSAATVFTKQVLARAAPPPPLEVASPIDYAMFSAIKKLRRRPERLLSPAVDTSGATLRSASASSFTSSDVRGFRPSAMDGFALSLSNADTSVISGISNEGAAALRKTYRSAVLRLFVADRIALGMVSLLQMQIFVVRVVAAWVAARALFLWI